MSQDHLIPISSALCALLLAACSQSAHYQQDWGTDDIVSGKSDGLSDDAKPIAFGDTVDGSVSSTSIELYALDLQAGDALEVVMETTSGNLAPHATLHLGLFSTVHSSSFAVNGAVLTKTYVATSTGTHIIAARAFQNQGAGEYSLTTTCTGGPCSGASPPPIVDDLTEGDIDFCLEEALACSLNEIKRFNGRVGPARARNALDACMEQTAAATGIACADTCDSPILILGFGEAAFVCDQIVEDLQFYADQSDACEQVLDDCMEICTDSASVDGIFSVCYSFGFNSTCPSYALTRSECGGPFDEGTDEDCHLLCESTDGAIMDDLDTICEDDCGPRPDVLDDF
ncbi:MAG: hypothetical protein GY811_29350 [Myxococcales bacterium]|nr:hypothetical protein [Myxococcales bacterium]